MYVPSVDIVTISSSDVLIWEVNIFTLVSCVYVPSLLVLITANLAGDPFSTATGGSLKVDKLTVYKLPVPLIVVTLSASVCKITPPEGAYKDVVKPLLEPP